MGIRTECSDFKFTNNGKLKLLIIVSTRLEIIQSYTRVVDKMVWMKY